jgi:hypothetical protein
MYSSIRDGDNALKHMNLALASPNFYPNTLHAEGRNPCSETYGGLGRMLQDMLIQSWGNMIRIFPGVPSTWDQAVFHNLRAEGGFEVSALRKNGVTKFVRIKSNAGEPCVIAPGFEHEFRIVNGKIEASEKDVYQIKIEKGEEAILYSESAGDLHIAPIQVSNGVYNFYGLGNEKK